MQLNSSSAKHKLIITTLLLALFALPFALQWTTVTAFDSKALMAGGAVIGNAASVDEAAIPASTNHINQARTVSGQSFIGANVR